MSSSQRSRDLAVLSWVAFALAVLSGHSFASGARANNQTFFVDPSGDDSQSGTQAQPWRTIEHGVSSLSPGDTLYLRGGRYPERDIDIDVAGTAAQPITIRAYPGEMPVIDGAFDQFRMAPNSDWELHDSQAGIYRSTQTLPGASQVYGYLGSSDGGYRLVPYEDYGPLSTQNEDYTDQWPYYYCGPGVFWNEDDQRIYVRLQHSVYQERMDLLVPQNVDPRQTELFLFPDETLFDFEPSAAHIVVEGFQDDKHALDPLVEHVPLPHVRRTVP